MNLPTGSSSPVVRCTRPVPKGKSNANPVQPAFNQHLAVLSREKQPRCAECIHFRAEDVQIKLAGCEQSQSKLASLRRGMLTAGSTRKL